jgi:hypothetical protein
MARHGLKAKPVEEQPGLDDGGLGGDDFAVQLHPEPGTEIVGNFRDEGGLVVPEVRPVYAAPPLPASVSEVTCTGCRRPIPVGSVLLGADSRPWCSPECHADWGGWSQ